MDSKEYIEKVLVGEIQNIVNGHKFLSFGLITAGIELLGILIDPSNNKFFEKGKSGERFRYAIKELFPNKYHQYNVKYKDDVVPDDKFDLYIELRCGLNHSTFPKPKIGLSEREHGGENLSIQDRKLILLAEDFFDDFKEACEKVLKKIERGEIKNKTLLNIG